MNYFNRYSCCLLTDGATRCLISDIQRNKFYLIPKGLYDLLQKEFPFKSITEIESNYGLENQDVLKEYLEFLLKNDIGFLDDEIIEGLIPLNLEYKVAEPITSIIIDIDQKSEHLLNPKIPYLIDNYRIRHLQIRCYDLINVDIISVFLSHLLESTLKSIELILPDSKEFINKTVIKKILNANEKLLTIIFTGSEKNEVVKHSSKVLIYVKDRLKNEKNCGIISSSYFNANLATYTLSNTFNSCLYKKIAIDNKGNIKNCPAMEQSFGNIEDVLIEEVYNHKDFKKYWNLTKDEIEVCKDCEFRYICTDCRAYTERTHQNKEGLDTSKPLKCGYNPYTREWEEWSKNPLKEKAIRYYGMEELVKK